MTRFLLLLSTLGLLAGCTLAADDVEPALPAVPVYQSNSVAYRLNGLPVVAHNYGSLLSAVFSFGRWFSPASGVLQPDGSLVLAAVDAQNAEFAGALQHTLVCQLPNFQGVGHYPLVAAGTSLQLAVYDAHTKEWGPAPSQPLAPAASAEVVVTAWDATTQHISGTFSLSFAAAGSAPAATATDGRFDLTLEP